MLSWKINSTGAEVVAGALPGCPGAALASEQGAGHRPPSSIPAVGARGAYRDRTLRFLPKYQQVSGLTERHLGDGMLQVRSPQPTSLQG